MAVSIAACGNPGLDDDLDAGAETDAGTSADGSVTPPSHGSNAPMIEFAFAGSTADLVNPERGFYVGYDILNPSSAARVRTGGHTLAIALVRLDSFRTAPIDAGFLERLTTGFAGARAAGIKLIVRFTYNSSLGADASRARILGHLEQLRPLLHANADVIAVMQAGFIGAWGEWHTSTNGLDNTSDRTAILNAILDALPADRNVQIRTPMYKAAAFPGGALAESEAYTGTERARVGHHNDCFLASASDFGTYATPVATWESYVADDGRFTAIGGETCAVYAPRSNCDAAVPILTAGHWSFLNREYNQAVLSTWGTQGCQAEIQRRLGYRFALARVAHTEAVAPGGELELQVDITNHGFAAPYNKRPVEVVLSNGASRLVAQLPDADARRWTPGATTRLGVRLRIPSSATPGSYTLALRLPDDAASLADDARYTIRLANDGRWDEDTGDNLLSDGLTIDPTAPGPRVASATSFVALP